MLEQGATHTYNKSFSVSHFPSLPRVAPSSADNLFFFFKQHLRFLCLSHPVAICKRAFPVLLLVFSFFISSKYFPLKKKRLLTTTTRVMCKRRINDAKLRGPALARTLFVLFPSFSLFFCGGVCHEVSKGGACLWNMNDEGGCAGVLLLSGPGKKGGREMEATKRGYYPRFLPLPIFPVFFFHFYDGVPGEAHKCCLQRVARFAHLLSYDARVEEERRRAAATVVLARVRDA